MNNLYIHDELTMQNLVNYVDNVNPNAMEQLVIFMCWFSPNLKKTDITPIMIIIQKIRMGFMETMTPEKKACLFLYQQNKYTKATLCRLFNITYPTLNKWLKDAQKKRLQIKEYSEKEYRLMHVFNEAFDTLCDAKEVIHHDRSTL